MLSSWSPGPKVLRSTCFIIASWTALTKRNNTHFKTASASSCVSIKDTLHTKAHERHAAHHDCNASVGNVLHQATKESLPVKLVLAVSLVQWH